jgi:HPt (histidine-containing phosphotransfer) domain-containing protein
LEVWLPTGRIQAEIKQEDSHDRLKKEDKLFHKAAVTFVKDNQDTFEKITNSLNSGDIKTAHRIAHTLKSSAGYLKKKELQEAAFSLELSLQNEPPDYTSKQLDIFEKELIIALHEFSPLLKEAESAKPDSVQIDAVKLAALISKLEPLLRSGDFSASNYVEELQGIIGMKELAERIDDYDFEGALQLLREIKM